MKKKMLGAIGAAFVAVVFVVLSVPVDAAEMRCNVPFSFQVRDATLPPGVYAVSTQGSIVTIRGASSAALSISNRLESRGDTPAKLVFHRYGDEYILKQAWTG